MNKTLIIASTIVTVGVTAATAAQLKTFVKDLQETFPEFDKKTIRKAYLKMITKSFRGQYDRLDFLSDDQMDDIFRVEVANVLNKK